MSYCYGMAFWKNKKSGADDDLSKDPVELAWRATLTQEFATVKLNEALTDKRTDRAAFILKNYNVDRNVAVAVIKSGDVGLWQQFLDKNYDLQFFNNIVLKNDMPESFCDIYAQKIKKQHCATYLFYEVTPHGVLASSIGRMLKYAEKGHSAERLLSHLISEGYYDPAKALRKNGVDVPTHLQGLYYAMAVAHEDVDYIKEKIIQGFHPRDFSSNIIPAAQKLSPASEMRKLIESYIVIPAPEPPKPAKQPEPVKTPEPPPPPPKPIEDECKTVSFTEKIGDYRLTTVFNFTLGLQTVITEARGALHHTMQNMEDLPQDMIAEARKKLIGKYGADVPEAQKFFSRIDVQKPLMP